MNLLFSFAGLLFTAFQIYYLVSWLRKKKKRYKSRKIGATDITPFTQIIAAILLGLMTTVFFLLKILEE